MASETQYFVVKYDNEAGGPFVAEGALLTWDAAASSGFIVTVIDDGTTGKLICALYTGTIPDNNDQLTQGGVTADTAGPAPNGDAELILYPAYFRPDVSLAATGIMAWTGPALGTTHSFLFDGQTGNVSAGDILTFSPGGQQCEVVTVESDVGASGELSVRWITFLDTLEFPDDNDTFSNGASGDGALNGLVHPRCYSPLHIHRLLADLHDDAKHSGDDVLSVTKSTPSARSTDQIVELKGTTVIDDTIAQHMFGGSVDQLGGTTQYSGLDVQVTDSDGGTQPVIIQDDSIVTAYWENAFMPDSIAGKVRILRKTREDGVNVDGKRIKGKLLRFNDFYFEGATTLGQASTALALFADPDGNNQTAEGTVAGAPYNTIVLTEGYQLIDYNNGNGPQPYALEDEFGSASSLQNYERTKWIQRRGSSETLFGRNAQLFTGVTIDFAYDAESGPFSEDEILVWGTEIPYTPLATAAQVWQVDDSGGPSYSDQTTGFNDATGANFTPFPATEEDELDFCAIGFDQPFARVVFDNAGGTAGTVGTVAWEYWNGTAWVAVSGLSDGTAGFTTAVSDGQVLTFTLPTDWVKNTINAVEAYYLRARVTNLYTVNPVYDQGFIGGDTFSVGEVVAGITSGALGRVLLHDAVNDILIVAQDSGVTAFQNAEEIAGLGSGIAATAGTVVTNSASGTMVLMALDDNGVDGFFYGQRTRGVVPADNQTVFGATSLETADCDAATSLNTRVINKQFIGSYTGAAYAPANFGMAIDSTDAIAADVFTDLLGATQQPPNNQTGTVTGGEAGDYVTAYAWDGVSTDVNGDPEPDFDEMLLGVALTGASTQVNVGTGNIPINTPQVGWLRVERDSDNELDLIAYDSHDGDGIFEIIGTAPSNAAIGNTVMRAFIDRVWATTGVPETYQAVQSGTNDVAISLFRGGVDPIKPFKGNAEFGATGFVSPTQRIADA